MLKKPILAQAQDAVYSLEEGLGARIVKIGVSLLLLGGLMVVYTATQFHGLAEPEAMEAAQAARVLHEEGRFGTRLMRPVDLWLLKRGLGIDDQGLQAGPQVQAMPLLSMAPAYPAALSVLFKLWPTDFRVQPRDSQFQAELPIVAFGLLCTLLTGIVVFWMGCLLFHRRAGLFAAGLFYVSKPVWAQAISGLETPLLMLLSALACTGAVAWVGSARAERGLARQSAGWLLLVAAGGALLLTRYAAWFLLPGLFVTLAFTLPRQGWLRAFLTVIVMPLFLVPWLVRNQQVSGTLFGTAPYFALEDTGTFEDERFLRSPDPKLVARQAERDLRRKAAVVLERELPRGLGGLAGGFLASALFLASMFFRFGDSRAAVLRWGLALSFVGWVGITGVYGDRGVRLLAVFFPATVVYAAAFFHLLLQRMNYQMRITNQLVILGTLAAAALPLLVTLAPPQPYRGTFTYHPGTTAWVCSMFDRDEWLVSDVPEATAWYGGQTSLKLPHSLEDFERIHDHVRFTNGLHFTRKTTNLPMQDGFRGRKASHRSWMALALVAPGPPEDFPLRIMDSPVPGQLVYLDRERRPKLRDTP